MYGPSYFAVSAHAATPEKAPWKSIRLEPGSIVVSSPGAFQHFVVSGIGSDGREKDVRGACLITSSDPKVIEVDQTDGVFIGKSPGRSEIRVSLNEASCIARVTVGDRPATMKVRFTPDVISILTTKGCNSSGCHGSPAGQSGLELSLFGCDVDADHRMIVKVHDGRRVNLQNPEQSLLLQKPSFASGPADRFWKMSSGQ